MRPDIKALQFLIKGYQMILSPWVGMNCRFHPTCSCYAHEALEKHGVIKGLYLTAMRLFRCHPWGGENWVDPVPDQFAWGDILRYKLFRFKTRESFIAFWPANRSFLRFRFSHMSYMLRGGFRKLRFSAQKSSNDDATQI